MTVTGAGSTWSNSSGVNIGNRGTGTLTIADGGIVTGPIVIATNAGAVGTLNIGAGAGDPAAAPGTITAPSLAFGAGTGTLNFNHTSATYVFAPAISGNGTVNVLAGTTTLTGANSYSGATNVNAGTLRAGALNTFSPNSAVTVASGGTLDLNGFNQTIASVTNAGLVNMGTGTAPGTVLTTTSYTGTGGTIALNTFLGGDNSPSDRLVINGGTASGTSGLRITNAGGSGDLTLGNGIPVVVATNGGTTAPGAFGLSGPVVAGPYEYFLFRGGVTPGNENDWFLRNVAGPIPPEPPGPTPPGPSRRPDPAGPNPAGRFLRRRPARPIARADPVLPPGGDRLCRDAGAGALDRQRDARDLSRTPGRPEPPDQERTRCRSAGAAPSGKGPSIVAAEPFRPSSTAISGAFRPASISPPSRPGRDATISARSSAIPRPTATCAASPSDSVAPRAARSISMRPASASIGPISALGAGISTAC